MPKLKRSKKPLLSEPRKLRLKRPPNHKNTDKTEKKSRNLAVLSGKFLDAQYRKRAAGTFTRRFEAISLENAYAPCFAGWTTDRHLVDLSVSPSALAGPPKLGVFPEGKFGHLSEVMLRDTSTGRSLRCAVANTTLLLQNRVDQLGIGRLRLASMLPLPHDISS
jgi:hypothetical protein